MKHTILITCPDMQGLVFNISSILLKHGLNIERNDEFVDKPSNQFFMRTVVNGNTNAAVLKENLCTCLPSEAQINVIEEKKKSIIILCTKENHCLGDLLLRYDSGELDVNIEAVISNHSNLQNLVGKFGIDFFHISTEGISREEHEKLVLEKCDEFNVDFLALAKYMRILSPNFVEKYKNKIINIHHSFLPAFIGANPYKQAYERGVKIIGATAHFVNNHLDEGPIITQDITKIDHTYSWQDMQKAGRDVEKVVFARAIELVLNDRVFIHGNKTVVF
ncbi:formyltetrahydrofolate deformylase [Helicobacter cappadocius]|uniref:Formyltetrahydrofolate deformylase n=1 Tax=Helicobacter cappadocius TaxID=3063998 RepID=A0AA90PTR9_9HELI|nr:MULTISPECIES: formyltetrahydrofolate deformylase [unclassified Helicobacter]MDO7253472.1 formyltetrahydrofolate deformylase [Helicobacter sp. faydin-H75]MDP2539399.1 formyltetrahydrofolate deformylase [Helicobacter sp. faydin-H76]